MELTKKLTEVKGDSKLLTTPKQNARSIQRINFDQILNPFDQISNNSLKSQQNVSDKKRDITNQSDSDNFSVEKI
jgi:hypothetical protein